LDRRQCERHLETLRQSQAIAARWFTSMWLRVKLALVVVLLAADVVHWGALMAGGVTLRSRGPRFPMPGMSDGRHRDLRDDQPR
jgi:hypothetical protein